MVKKHAGLGVYPIFEIMSPVLISKNIQFRQV
jgi:hypothetical protein